MLTDILSIAAGFAGFSIAAYIFGKKKSGHPMVCPAGAKCDGVIHSQYSAFLGIPVESLGMGYYLLVVLGRFLIISETAALLVPLGIGLFALSAAAAFFSLYLIFLQALIIKQWCSWCLMSAALSLLIFGLSLEHLPGVA